MYGSRAGVRPCWYLWRKNRVKIRKQFTPSSDYRSARLDVSCIITCWHELPAASPTWRSPSGNRGAMNVAAAPLMTSRVLCLSGVFLLKFLVGSKPNFHHRSSKVLTGQLWMP